MLNLSAHDGKEEKVGEKKKEKEKEKEREKKKKKKRKSHLWVVCPPVN